MVSELAWADACSAYERAQTQIASNSLSMQYDFTKETSQATQAIGS